MTKYWILWCMSFAVLQAHFFSHPTRDLMVTSNLSSHVDMHTHAGSTLHNPVTLTFDLFTSWSMRAEYLPWSSCIPSLVLIAQAIFLLEHGHMQTHWVTDATDHCNCASAVATMSSRDDKLDWLSFGCGSPGTLVNDANSHDVSATAESCYCCLQWMMCLLHKLQEAQQMLR